MRAVAVIVGINDYKDQPLTSAVNGQLGQGCARRPGITH